MVNKKHLKILRKGVEVWNKWREDNPEIIPDLCGANLNGEDIRRANLSKTDLREASISKVNLSEADLREASLNESILSNADLSEAYLIQANLSNVNLKGTNLSKTYFSEANLNEVDLTGTDLSESNLNKANLCGVLLVKANLNKANLRWANLNRVDLSEADLRETNLMCVNFGDANLSRADLQYANLKGAYLQDAQLQKAKLMGTNLRDANLQYANLDGVTGLLGQQLAGANVAKTKLPGKILRFDALKYVDKISKSAQKLYITVLLVCAYSMITIIATKDVLFIKNSNALNLPIFKIPFPVTAFYSIAPLLLLGLYFYLHIYLQRIWEGMASLPAVFPNGRAINRKVTPCILNGIIRHYFSLLRSSSQALSRLQTTISILLAWWLIPFTILFIWGSYLSRNEWIGTTFHIFLLVVSIMSGIFFYSLAKGTLCGRRYHPFRWKKAWKYLRFYRLVLQPF